MANGNPFFVQPAQHGQAIGQLGQALGQFGQSREQQRQQEQQQAALQELSNVYQSGDPSQMADFVIRNPQLQPVLESAFGFTNEATKPIAKQTYAQVLADPDNAVTHLQRGIEQVRAAGGQPTNMMRDLQALQQDPSAIDGIKLGVAGVAPDVWKAYQDTQPKVSEGKPMQMGTGAMSGYTFDPNTGQYSIQPEIKEQLTTKAEEKAAEGVKLGAKDRQSINKDFTSLIKDTVGISRAADSLEKLKASSSPSAQLAAIFSFMKSLDPTSVVREGEQQMARNTGGPADALVGYVNQLVGEGSLPPAVFQDMVNTARSLSNAAIESSGSEATAYLDTYEDTLPDKFKSSLLKRIPKTKPVSGISPQTKGEQSVFRAPPAPMSPEERARRSQSGQPAPAQQVQPGQFTSSGGVTFTVRG